MKKKLFLALVVPLVLVLVGAVGALFVIGELQKRPFSERDSSPLSLTQEDIRALTEPGVVRVMHVVQGEASFPDFRVNYDTGEVIPAPDAAPMRKSFEGLTFMGSGFVVRSDGYIVTSAQVVSSAVVKRHLAEDYSRTYAQSFVNTVMAAALGKQLHLLPADLRKLLAKSEAEQKVITDTVSRNLMMLALAQGEYRLEQNVVVLSARSAGARIDEYRDQGIPAVVVSVNDTFFENGRDFALLKVERTDLPALPLSHSGELAVGSTVFTFGFPSATDGSGRAITAGTLSAGAVSAFTASKPERPVSYKTNIVASAGSSGGPLLDMEGNVVGVITALPAGGEVSPTVVALPVGIMMESLEANGVQKDRFPIALDGAKYTTLFREGLKLESGRHCVQANEKYRAASRLGMTLSPRDYTEDRIASCEEAIVAGSSIDTLYDERREMWRKISPSLKWTLGAGGILFLVGVGGVLMLIGRTRSGSRPATTPSKPVTVVSTSSGAGGSAVPPTPPLGTGRSFFQSLAVSEEHIVLGANRGQDITDVKRGV